MEGKSKRERKSKENKNIYMFKINKLFLYNIFILFYLLNNL